jgi:hypothetical protein
MGPCVAAASGSSARVRPLTVVYSAPRTARNSQQRQERKGEPAAPHAGDCCCHCIKVEKGW